MPLADLAHDRPNLIGQLAHRVDVSRRFPEIVQGEVRAADHHQTADQMPDGKLVGDLTQVSEDLDLAEDG
jgi:hypothetical protein